MSGIRGSNTKLELLVRRALHKRGFRFRIDGAKLLGRPDIVLPRFKTAVFVHGCFWHGHNCYLFRPPKTRVEFWQNKINANRERDSRVSKELTAHGWNVHVVWECSLRDVTEEKRIAFFDDLATKIRSSLDRRD